MLEHSALFRCPLLLLEKEKLLFLQLMLQNPLNLRQLPLPQLRLPQHLSLLQQQKLLQHRQRQQSTLQEARVLPVAQLLHQLLFQYQSQKPKVLLKNAPLSGRLCRQIWISTVRQHRKPIAIR